MQEVQGRLAGLSNYQKWLGAGGKRSKRKKRQTDRQTDRDGWKDEAGRGQRGNSKGFCFFSTSESTEGPSFTHIYVTMEHS